MSTQVNGKLYHVTLQAHFAHATSHIKFPCLFFIQWKTSDHKLSTETGRHSPQDRKVTFEQTAVLTVPLVYDRAKHSFLKKESQVQLNLLSKSRPDQPKLVGRVTIDLASIVNNNLYTKETEFPLEFCSVSASLTASFKLVQKIQTDVEVFELQKSIGDGLSFYSTLRVGQQPQSILDKSKDSGSINREGQNGSLLEKHVVIKKQYSTGGTSPKAKQSERQFRQVLNSSFQEKKETDPKSEAQTKSVKGARMTDLIEGSNRKIGSVLSQQSRLGEQNVKLKVEVDTLRLQIGRYQQQSQRLRSQSNNKGKEIQLSRIQLRQKETSLDQVVIDNSSLKSESQRLREEVTILREGAVSHTIKLADLKDSYNRVSSQLSAAETQMKRLEGANEHSTEAKKEIALKSLQLQGQLNQYQEHCHELQKERVKLQESLSRSGQEEQRLRQSNLDLKLEVQKVGNELKAEIDIRNSHQVRIQSLEEQLKHLHTVQQEYEESRRNWDINQGLHSQQLARKTDRVLELQQILLTINQRVRYLQGENQLLTQNGKRTRQQLLALSEDQKTTIASEKFSNQQLSRVLQEERIKIANMAEQKGGLQENLMTINSRLQSLTQEYQLLNNQHMTLSQGQLKLQAQMQEQQQKRLQLQELLLSANQQRLKELSEAAEKQRALEMKAMELEHQINSAKEQASMQDQRLFIMEEELRGREDLISKLKQGLNSQVQRTDDLNNKLMVYYRKDENMKDLIAMLSEEQTKIRGLLSEQESNDIRNQRKLTEKQQFINDLVQQLNQIGVYSRQLLHKSQEHQAKIQGLQLELEYIHRKESELNLQNTDQLNQLKQLKHIISELEQNSRSQIEDKQKIESQLLRDTQAFQKQKLELSIQVANLEERIIGLNEKIVEQQTIILNETERGTSKEAELTESKKQIAVISSSITELQIKMSEFENELLLKEQMLQEQANRYNQLQVLYEALSNDQASFDLMRHHQEIRELNDSIKQLQSEVSILGNEASKIPSLQRSLKIKTIELNSMKFKGKGEGSDGSQLIRLKDQQISSLQNQKEHLLTIEREFLKMQNEVNALKIELQMMEEQKFNTESLSNERALALEEVKQENRKLLEEITIIGERHGELQKMLFEANSSEVQPTNKSEKTPLKRQPLNRKKLQLQESALPQVQHTNNTSKITEVCQQLKKMLLDRATSGPQQKIIQNIDKLHSKDNHKLKKLEQKKKVLSRDFGILKIQCLRVGEGRDSKQKTKVASQIQICESAVNQIMALVD